MDPISLMIVISIGNVVAWVVAIYTRNGVHALLTNVVICSLGAFAGGYGITAFLPEFGSLGLIFSAFAGAIAVLYAVRAGRSRPTS